MTTCETRRSLFMFQTVRNCILMWWWHFIGETCNCCIQMLIICENYNKKIPINIIGMAPANLMTYELIIHNSELCACVYFSTLSTFSSIMNFRNRCFIHRVFGWSLSSYTLITTFPTALERSNKLLVTEQSEKRQGAANIASYRRGTEKVWKYQTD